MSETGHKRHFDRAPVNSGLPLCTDIGGTGQHVSKMPNPEVAATADTAARPCRRSST
jgi:hypothetical protein